MKTSLVIAMALVAGIAIAQEESPVNQSFEEDSGFYAECTSYYELVVDAVESTGEAETAQVYTDLKDTAMLYAFVLALPGRDENMAAEVVNARIELYKKKMMEDIGGRNENLSILINRHGEACLAAVQEPRESVGLASAAANVDPVGSSE